jgi:hypothetical protein
MKYSNELGLQMTNSGFVVAHLLGSSIIKIIGGLPSIKARKNPTILIID